MTESMTLAALPPIPMTLCEGQPRVTSRDVADIFGKQHKNVLQAIDQLECSEGFRRLNFQPSSYLNAQNKPQPMVEMTRDGFTFLAMGFTGPRAAQFKEAFIAAFNAMEVQLRGGSALPMLAETVTRMQVQVQAVLERQELDTSKLNALLDLVDVTKRYVGLLEGNQRPKPKTYSRITHELVVEVRQMLAAGLTISEVCRQFNIGRGTAQRISTGEWQSYLADKLRAQQGAGHV